MKTEQKLELTLKLLSETQQAYHTLANMNAKDRHQSILWTECSEQSCKTLMEIVDQNELQLFSPLMR